MSTLASELELEGELESEAEALPEASSAQQGEHEQEQEHEAFFNHLAAMGDRVGRPQQLRRIALAAARSALRAAQKPYPTIEGELEAPSMELELGLQATPSERAHSAATMEHIGHAAAEAANEQEAAEHFLPLIGLAAKFVAPKLLRVAGKLGGKLLGKIGSRLVRRVGPRVMRRVAPKLLRRVAPRALGRVSPQLTRAVGNITRTLYRNPSTRPLIHAVPRIARGTMRRLVWNVARGKPVTPRLAVRQLARQTVRTLSNPRALGQIYRRSLAMDRRFHRYSRRLVGSPQWPLLRGVAPHVSASLPAGGCACRCSCPQGAAATTTVMTPLGPAFRAAVCPTCGR